MNEYLDYFTLPGAGIAASDTSGNERYYDFVQGPVQFFVIDSQGALNNGSDLTAQQKLAPIAIGCIHHALPDRVAAPSTLLLQLVARFDAGDAMALRSLGR